MRAGGHRAARLGPAAALVAALLVAVSGAFGRTADEPGVTSPTILIGATAPLSTADGATARGAAAYFRHVNARGGVNGRTIVYRIVDDGGDPARALRATRQLVERDGVFAVAGASGAASLATREYLNAARVPQLFAASGAAVLGDFRRYPATIAFATTHRTEGWIYGRYLARARPDATIAVLFEDDDYGFELLEGLREGVAGSRARIVATQGHAPAASGVQTQTARLKASGASVLALFASRPVATRVQAAAAAVGWRPTVVLGSDGETADAAEGSLTMGFLKEPADARWRDDPGLRLYRSIMARYERGANAADTRHVYGMALAYETVQLLKSAGPSPTRAAVLARLSRLNDPSNPFLLPGIEVRTTPTRRVPIEQAQLRRFTGGRWRPFGGLWSYQPGRR